MRFSHNRLNACRFPWIGILVAVLTVAGIALAVPARNAARVARSAGIASDHVPLEMRWLDINTFKCPITNYGFIGNNNAENRAGGEWPSGSGEYYLYGGGIWIGGTVDQGPFTETIGANTVYSFKPSTTNPLGWAGLGGTAGSRAILTDPRAVIGYEPSGGTAEMAPLTKVFFSTESDWPLAAKTAILDTYTEYDDQDPQRWNTGTGSNSGKDTGKWSGTPTASTIATYGLGVKVKQTTYSWNYSNNSDIHFVVYDVENVRTDNKTINNCFVGVVSDPDIGSEAADDMAGFDASRNLGYAYDSDFSEAEFGGVPGFIGYRFLKSPIAEHDIDKNGDGVIDNNPVLINSVPVTDIRAGQQIGLHAYKIFGRIAGDPANEWEWYMTMAGHNFREDQNQVYQPFDLSNTPEDQRFLQTTGPFTLKPGQPVQIVVAMMVAKAAGVAGDPVSTRVTELQRVSDVAQSIYDHNFLLPVPPKAPTLTARAGDRKVYLSWDTAAETTADPFYTVASDASGSLYDPKYKQFDFEGYRVWKSLTGRPDDWTLLADFDKRSVVPRDASITVQAGAYAGTVTYDAATTEDYFLHYGGTSLFNGHEFVVMMDGATKKMKVYDVGLDGLEIPCNTYADGMDWWYEVGDNSQFELFDSNLNYLSADSTLNANGTYDEYVPGMIMYLAGMAIQFDNVPAPAGNVIWHIMPSQEADYGANTTVAHSYVDENLTNGKTYFYAVTSYDFQLSSPRSLESGKSLSQAAVVPRSEPNGMTNPAASAVTHSFGSSDGVTTVEVVDPSAVTGHTYQVGFHSNGKWFVRDANKAAGVDTVVNNVVNQTGGFDYPIVDGVKVSVVGPSIGIESSKYTPSANKWFVERAAGYEVMTGVDWGWGTTVTGADYARIEVRFNGGSTRAPVYVRGASPSYSYQGAGTIPAEIWDVTNNRRLAAAFVEQNGVASRDGIWTPSTAPDGGREYLFIFAQTYDPDTTSAQWAFYKSKSIYYDQGQFPIMTTSWLVSKAGMSPTTGDVWKINPYLVNTPNDVFEYKTTARVAVDTLLDMSKITVVPNPFIIRHELMPNENNPALYFTNLPPSCNIRIFTLAGDLVTAFNHNAGTTASGTAVWDLRNNNFQRVASGLYLYHVQDASGRTFVGKFAVVR